MNKQNVPVIIQKQKQFLAQWLRERDMERIMTTTEHPEEDAECSGRDAGPAVRHETGESPGNYTSDSIQPGQIRLLARGVGGVENRLLYAAILSEWNADPKEWLIAPFSSYTTPAVRGELLLRPTGALSLRVLCLWNARNVADRTMSRSWLVDELNGEEQREAANMLRYTLHGDPLPEELHPRIGPPILKPDDPRRAYEREEITLWDGVQQDMDAGNMTTEMTEDGIIDLTFFLIDAGAGYELAAEETDMSRPLKMRRYSSRDGFVEIMLAECEKPGFLSLEIRKDPDGELEKGVVTDQWGNPLAVIEQGCALIRTEPGVVIRIYNRNKKIMLLECAHYK